MPVHDVCTLYAGACLRITPVSLWYPLEGITGYTAPIRPDWAENWHVGGALAGLQLQRVSIRDGHIGGEQTHLPPGPYGPALRNG